MNRLSHYILKFREENGYNQTDLAELLLGNSEKQHTISRIEKGHYKSKGKLFQKLITSLSKISGVEQKVLLDWYNEESDDGEFQFDQHNLPIKIKVVSGHSIWSTPLILNLLQNESIADTISFASGTNEMGGLNIFDSKVLDAGNCNKLSEQGSFEALSGKKALEFLNSGATDLALVAGELISDNRNFLPILTIANQCSYSLVVEDTKSLERLNLDASNTISQADLGELLKDLRNNCRPAMKPALATEWGTAAHRIAINAWHSILEGEDRIKAQTDHFNISSISKNFKKSLSYNKIKSAAETERVPKDICGLITWEPMASWLMNSQDDKRLRKFSIKPVTGVDGRVQNITFELVALRSKVENSHVTQMQIKKLLNILIPELTSTCNSLNKIDSASIQNIEATDLLQPLIRLAPYFSMAKPNDENKEIAFIKSIGATDFSISISPDYWLLANEE